MAQQPSRWSLQHNRSAYFPILKSSEVYRRNYNWPKTLTCSASGATLTNLLRQQSTITCCDRFVRNCVNIDNTEPPIPTEQRLERMPWSLTLSKAAMKSICTILASFPLSNTFFSVCYKHNTASQVPRPFRYANRVVACTPLCSINRRRRTDSRCSNTLDKIKENGL